jgi:hypothetical protein
MDLFCCRGHKDYRENPSIMPPDILGIFETFHHELDDDDKVAVKQPHRRQPQDK